MEARADEALLLRAPQRQPDRGVGLGQPVQDAGELEDAASLVAPMSKRLLVPRRRFDVIARGRDDEVLGTRSGRRRADVRFAMELDDRTETSFGRRVIDWELKGVPVRVEVGPRDLAVGAVTLVRRDTRTKEQAAILGLPHHVDELLGRIQADLLAEAEAERDARTADAKTIDEAASLAQEGFVRVPWQVLRDDKGFKIAQMEAVISQTEIRAVTEVLLPLIGPVAPTLVARQAEKAVGRDDFYRRLSDFIPSERDRASFLRIRGELDESKE